MKVSTHRSDLTVTRRFAITTDHPIVPMAYSTTGKRVRVVGGTIHYKWVSGAWVVKSEYDIKLGTVALKADGTDSKNEHSRNPSTVSWKDKSYTPEFAWLQPIVDLLRPRGDLSMTALNEHEVGE